MKLKAVSPKVATKDILHFRPERKSIDVFKQNLLRLINRVDEIEREENQKNYVRDFLLETYYKDTNDINTKSSTDLVIRLGKTNKDKVGVILEAKRPSNKSEMLTLEKPNVKALHELVLYYMRERIDEGNIDIKNCIATNIYEWYIFDVSFFEKYFIQNKSFVKEYKDWRDGRKVSKDTALFYNEIVKPYLDTIEDTIPVTKFDLRTYEKVLKKDDKKDDKRLIALYKAQSPYHLLRKATIDSNALNDKFYKELLHILGLEEVKVGSKNIIRRKENNKNSGALIENAISILEIEDIDRVNNIRGYGDSREEQLYNIALELSLTWVNRILFLKLLEGQLIRYNNSDPNYLFLNSRVIHDFDELHKLFHHVLARKPEQRSDSVKEKYTLVPYLNSSLFELSDLERDTIRINALDNSAILDLMHGSVLSDKKKSLKSLPLIQYIFSFLDAYDFASEVGEEIQEDNRSLINASVLGKVFEKINGYRDGSIYTPGHITMFMCRESIRRAILFKFNEKYKWSCSSLDDVYNNITDIKEADSLVNSLKICDPAVGSGHFLVSALNEILAIKSELGILQDENGKRLKDYNVEVIDDELVLTDSYGDPFIYKPHNRESQRIQRLLFNEKQTIIENCLFGVDLNMNSVKICRLRLWIELLKHSYYKEETNFRELETLPNIDINIKAGNSLISKYNIDSDLKSAFGNSNHSMLEYKEAVDKFKNETDREQKRILTTLISNIKNSIESYFSIHDSRRARLSKLRGQLVKLQSDTLFKEDRKKASSKKKKEALVKKINVLESEVEEIKNNIIYENSFEWRIEFPEVLNSDGDFEGFDLIIGNPPYIQLQKLGKYADCLSTQSYQTYVRTGDIYCLFYELGVRLLKQNGLLCYITSNKWMRASYGKTLREYLLESANPIQLIDFAGIQVFDAATVDVNMLLLKKEPYNGSVSTCLISEEGWGSLKKMSDYFSHRNTLVDFKNSKNSWIILSETEQKIKTKIETLGTPLSGWGISIYRGILTGYNEAFIIDNKVRDELIQKCPKSEEIIRPILLGKNIKRYSYSWEGMWLINTHNGNKKNKVDKVNVAKDYPAVYEYLLQYKQALEKRYDKGSHWTNLRNCSYLNEFEMSKIGWGNLALKPQFCLIPEGYYINAPSPFFVTNQTWILAVLNSSICNFYIKQLGVTRNGGYIEYKPMFIECFPIPNVDNQLQKRLQSLLSKINNTNNVNVENEINELLYDFYGFTIEERKHIDLHYK